MESFIFHWYLKLDPIQVQPVKFEYLLKTESWRMQNKIFFKCLSFCLSVCLSVYLSICLSVYLSICLSVYLSICLSVYRSVYLYIFLSVYLSVYLSICLSVYLSIFLFFYLSICLSICLSVCLSIYFPICLSVYLSVYLSISLKTPRSKPQFYTLLQCMTSPRKYHWPNPCQLQCGFSFPAKWWMWCSYGRDFWNQPDQCKTLSSRLQTLYIHEPFTIVKPYYLPPADSQVYYSLNS